MADEHEDDHDEHDHGTLRFQGAEASDATVEALRATNPALAECLALTRRWGELTEEEKKAAPEIQRKVEHFGEWTPGYHSTGDLCATCGKPVEPLFRDRFEQGAVAYAAFVSNLPVHATPGCLGGFAKARPDLSPRAVDKARRELTKDLNRPSAGMSQFFRHDVLLHPPFALEDWANSVMEANPRGLDKPTMKDMDRLMQWMHKRLFHGH
ncbi:MAG: hypothetical protein QOE90_2991 [Thermoplasmata archaeon]|jgi:hypothetical protein|nr:hypothetical protein [Thermoplasmata archaeon]